MTHRIWVQNIEAGIPTSGCTGPVRRRTWQFWIIESHFKVVVLAARSAAVRTGQPKTVYCAILDIAEEVLRANLRQHRIRVLLGFNLCWACKAERAVHVQSYY